MAKMKCLAGVFGASAVAWTLLGLYADACVAVQPASVFTDNMVLQRDRHVPIWGTAAPGKEVEVRIGRATATTVADAEGKWIVILAPLPTNAQPQTLNIRCDNRSASVANVLVGDVWLCSGQSNMQMPLRDAAGGEKYAEQFGDNSRIRLLLVPKHFTSKEQASQAGQWAESTSNRARDFSAVAFVFGATLAGSPSLRDVPIGLIDSSFGGTAVEGWISADDLSPFDQKDLGNSLFGRPNEHFNAMIRPLLPMAIRGVVWYQGESNSDRPAVYGKLLKTMIGSWRRDFRNPQLPFLVVQLPSFNAPFQRHFFTWIREQQAKVAGETPDVSLVVSYDTHDGSDLHPREKIPIGKRAARAAQKMVYGESLPTAGPRYLSHVVAGNAVQVRFDTGGKKLVTSDGDDAVRGFQLAGADGRFHFAQGKITGDDSVTVTADRLTQPKFIRFAWAGVPNANLASTADWPAIPFRTDDFPSEDVEFVRVPNHRAVKTPYYEAEVDAIGSLRSLGVAEEQFVANDLGMNGGSCIPTFFGPRYLNQVEEVGPRQLVFHDSEVSVSYTFHVDRIQLDISNQSADEITYQIALAPRVTIAGDVSRYATKAASAIRIEGFHAADSADSDNAMLRVAIPSGKSRALWLKVARPRPSATESTR